MPCLAKAGSITVHHVRAVHGSATNFSGKERRRLLFQYRAADAWPLLGFAAGIEKFDELLLVGDPTLAPRLAPVPVRLPLPPAEYQGSIYEPACRHRRFFETAPRAGVPRRCRIAGSSRSRAENHLSLSSGGRPTSAARCSRVAVHQVGLSDRQTRYAP